MTQFGGGTIAGVIDGFVQQPMQPPIGISLANFVPAIRPVMLNGAIGSAPNQVAPNATTPSIIAENDTPAMNGDGVVVEWGAAMGTWALPVPPVLVGTGSGMSAPVANRVQMTLSPAGLYEDIVTGTLLTCSAATGTPGAIAALNAIVASAVLAPHVAGAPTITLASVGANLIDWTGATCTVTKT